jgi:hypothetical protein
VRFLPWIVARILELRHQCHRRASAPEPVLEVELHFVQVNEGPDKYMVKLLSTYSVQYKLLGEYQERLAATRPSADM